MNKLKIIFASLIICISTGSYSQEQEYDCTCGVVIGNGEYSERPLTIAYSKTFTAKCKKGNSLYLDQGIKSSIKVQFFNKLLADYPQYLEPFKNKSARIFNIWVVNSESEFEGKIDKYYGTSYQNYNILKTDDFVYDPNKYSDLGNKNWQDAYSKMQKYLMKN